jgi:hypothetical protein
MSALLLILHRATCGIAHEQLMNKSVLIGDMNKPSFNWIAARFAAA